MVILVAAIIGSIFLEMYQDTTRLDMRINRPVIPVIIKSPEAVKKVVPREHFVWIARRQYRTQLSNQAERVKARFQEFIRNEQVLRADA